jgi:FAD dependent monooxygenase
MEPTAVSSRKPFRVIIVGAGVAGLSLSHALQLANIEHVVLEKHRDIVSLHGAALTIFPGAARILDQFGILESIQDSVIPVQKEFIRWPDGTINTNPSNHPNMKSHFDIAPISFNRQRLVTHLYDGLPDKSMIRTNARVRRIEVRNRCMQDLGCKKLKLH